MKNIILPDWTVFLDCGIELHKPYPTYPAGLPDKERRGILGIVYLNLRCSAPTLDFYLYKEEWGKWTLSYLIELLYFAVWPVALKKILN